MNGFQWLAAGWWVFPVSTTNNLRMIQEYVLSVLLICIDLKVIDGNGIYFLIKLINSFATRDGNGTNIIVVEILLLHNVK
jgi:hypothetical protein